MDAKLNQSDLISLLAKGSNISVAKAELFTKNFFDLIIEGLEKDGIVKINGLGTFRITDVASRGSVNVNTGEKIEIKGHKKLTFTPADALKESVNQPFAMFEPVEVDDTYQPESTGETENDDTADLADEVEQPDNVEEAIVDSADAVEETEPTTEEVDAPETVKETEIPETAVEENSAVEEQAVEEDITIEPVEENIQENNDTTVSSVEQPEPVPTKKKNRWIYALFVILGFVVGFVAVRMLGRDAGSNVGDSAVADTAKTTVPSPKVNEPVAAENEVTANIDTLATIIDETVATTVDDAVTTTAETEQPAKIGQAAEVSQDVYTFVMVEELVAINLRDISMADTLLYVADGELARHTVATDETFVKIANKYFGDKKLWPYIVKYNNMRNPNSLRSGMEIAIPRLLPKK